VPIDNFLSFNQIFYLLLIAMVKSDSNKYISNLYAKLGMDRNLDNWLKLQNNLR